VTYLSQIGSIEGPFPQVKAGIIVIKTEQSIGIAEANGLGAVNQIEVLDGFVVLKDLDIPISGAGNVVF
jgi:hypothetical protein